MKSTIRQSGFAREQFYRATKKTVQKDLRSSRVLEWATPMVVRSTLG